MQTFTVAYQYLMIGETEIKANTLEEAKAIVMEDCAVYNGKYCDDSFEINDQYTDFLNEPW